MKIIDTFEDEYRFLSNFFIRGVYYGGIVWPAVEYPYQAYKTLDMELREQILMAATPGQAKRLGQKVPLRPHWEYLKVIIMNELLCQKFHPATDLAGELLATDDAILIEGNTWHDQFWGNCCCKRHFNTPGLNWLGELLMITRDNLRNAETF